MIPVNSEIRIEPTTMCNYNCTICCHNKLTRKLEKMSFDLFKTLLDKITSQTDQYKFCTFSGFGEPLLDGTLDKKIAYAKRKKGLEVLMLTNASLLTMKKFKSLDALGVSSIRISFYGDSAGVYNKVHGVSRGKSFGALKELLTGICAAKRSTKILLTYNIEKGVNEDDAKSWIEYWKDKADLIEMWRPHNWVDGKDYRKVQKAKSKTCGRPFKGPLQVQVDGTVNMCCFDFDGKLTLGDLKTRTLDEIFNSSLFKKIVKCHETGNFSGSGLICEHCDQRNSDKSDVMVYNSKFDIEERVKKISTTYQSVAQ